MQNYKCIYSTINLFQQERKEKGKKRVEEISQDNCPFKINKKISD